MAARQQLGTDWAKSISSVPLIVPSAAVEGEWNVLVNPTHPDFAKITVSAANLSTTTNACSNTLIEIEGGGSEKTRRGQAFIAMAFFDGSIAHAPENAYEPVLDLMAARQQYLSRAPNALRERELLDGRKTIECV
jgi:hypothetical protein